MACRPEERQEPGRPARRHDRVRRHHRARPLPQGRAGARRPRAQAGLRPGGDGQDGPGQAGVRADQGRGPADGRRHRRLRRPRRQHGADRAGQVQPRWHRPRLQRHEDRRHLRPRQAGGGRARRDRHHRRRRPEGPARARQVQNGPVRPVHRREHPDGQVRPVDRRLGRAGQAHRHGQAPGRAEDRARRLRLHRQADRGRQEHRHAGRLQARRPDGRRRGAGQRPGRGRWATWTASRSSNWPTPTTR